jgi:hypothetical protein
LTEPVVLNSGSNEEFVAAQAFCGTRWGFGFDAATALSIFVGNHASLVERDIVLELALTLGMTTPATPLVLLGVAPGGRSARGNKVGRYLPGRHTG